MNAKEARKQSDENHKKLYESQMVSQYLLVMDEVRRSVNRGLNFIVFSDTLREDTKQKLVEEGYTIYDHTPIRISW